MNRINYFQEILAKCEREFSNDHSLIPLEWIIKQLKFVIALEKGESVDLNYLNSVKIGWIASMELNGWENKDLIHQLCLVSKEVDKVKLERGFQV